MPLNEHADLKIRNCNQFLSLSLLHRQVVSKSQAIVLFNTTKRKHSSSENIPNSIFSMRQTQTNFNVLVPKKLWKQNITKSIHSTTEQLKSPKSPFSYYENHQSYEEVVGWTSALAAIYPTATYKIIVTSQFYW